MSADDLLLTSSQLHAYLADAYRRGADHQRHGIEMRGNLIPFPENREHVYAQSESWAREYIDLRLENGLIVRARPPEPEKP